MFGTLTKILLKVDDMMPPLPVTKVGKVTRNIITSTLGEKPLNTSTIQQLISGQVLFPPVPEKVFTEPTIGSTKLIDHVRAQIDMDRKGRTAVVTGVNGAVGAYLAELLLALDYKVIGLDINERYTLDLKKLGGDRYRFFRADITDLDGLLGILTGEEVEEFLDGERIDELYHPAAIFRVDKSIPWERFEAVNIHGSVKVAQVVKELEIPAAVFWITTAIYKGYKEPCNEETEVKVELLAPYEKSKYLGYLAVEEYRTEHELPISYIEPTSIIGPYNAYGVGKASKLIANGLLLANFGDTVSFNLIYVQDVIGAAVVLANKLRSRPEKFAGERYIISDDVPMKFPDFLAVMRYTTNDRKPYPWIRIPDMLIPLGGEFIEYWTGNTHRQGY